MPERVVIIGSGPAGWAAAIYTARANLEPLVFEGAETEKNRLQGTQPLGQLALTTEVENYPGFPAGDMGNFLDDALKDTYVPYRDPKEDPHRAVTGPELMELMRQQAKNFGTRIVTDDVVEVDLSSRPFKLKTLGGEETEAHALIIATGARANYLGLESEDRFKNKGVSACAVCDGALPRFRNHPLVVVGGGDSAMEESTFLSKFASKVYIIHRRDKFRASPIMAERALSNEKIDVKWNSAVEEVLGNDEQGVTGVRLRSTTGRKRNRGTRSQRLFRGHRAHAEHRFPPRPTQVERQGLHPLDDALPHLHQRGRRVRGGGRGGRLLPPGHHRRRHRLHGRLGRRTLAGVQRR